MRTHAHARVEILPPSLSFQRPEKRPAHAFKYRIWSTLPATAPRDGIVQVILCSLLSPRVVLSFEFHDTRLSLSHRSPLPPSPLHLLRVFFRNRFPLGDTDEARNWIWVNSSFDHQPSLRLDGLPRLYSEQRDFHIFSSFLSFLNSNPRIFFFLFENRGDDSDDSS